MTDELQSWHRDGVRLPTSLTCDVKSMVKIDHVVSIFWQRKSQKHKKLAGRLSQLTFRTSSKVKRSKVIVTRPVWVAVQVTASGGQWCGLRPSVLRQDRSETKQNRSWSWTCSSGVVLWNTILSCTRRHNDLEGHSNFLSIIYSFSLFCAWNITTVEINSGVYLLKS